MALFPRLNSLECLKEQFAYMVEKKPFVVNALTRFVLPDVQKSGYVWEGKKGCENFIPTRGHSRRPPDVYAIDTEQCDIADGANTTKAIVSIVVVDCLQQKIIYEKLVNPSKQGFVVNYNEWIHGIDPDVLLQQETSLKDVQGFLLAILKSDSILLGHDLRSDLRALQIVHKRIIDTQRVFHPDYQRPMKLKDLIANELAVRIQEGRHDSKEDALAAMYLMLHKIEPEVPRDRRGPFSPVPRTLPGRGRPVYQGEPYEQEQVSSDWRTLAGAAIAGTAAAAVMYMWSRRSNDRK